MAKKKHDGNAIRKEPGLEQWERLYAAAAALKAQAPWNMLWDADIVTLQLPGREEPVFCSVMGRAGECYGIGIYPGFDALHRLDCLMASEEGCPPGLFTFEQSCLMCYFGDREEVDPRDRAVMQALGLKFRGRNQWIYFRALEPGYYPWFLTAGQAELLTEALENLFEACRSLLLGEIHVDFEAGETLLRLYSQERREWLTLAAPLPPASVKRKLLQLTDELLIARLKNQKRMKVKLELDAFYAPMPVQETKDAIPYLPRVTILADREQGLLLNQHMAQPGEKPANIIVGMLLDYITEHGRPSAVYVRDDRMSPFLEKICSDIGVRLVVGEGMPASNDFFVGLSDFVL